MTEDTNSDAESVSSAHCSKPNFTQTLLSCGITTVGLISGILALIFVSSNAGAIGQIIATMWSKTGAPYWEGYARLLTEDHTSLVPATAVMCGSLTTCAWACCVIAKLSLQNCKKISMILTYAVALFLGAVPAASIIFGASYTVHRNNPIATVGVFLTFAGGLFGTVVILMFTFITEPDGPPAQ
jgi:hypothetical protein